MSTFNSILRTKLIRNTNPIQSLIDDYKNSTSSITKFMSLLKDEDFNGIRKMVLENELIEVIDLTSFWESIYEVYHDLYEHPIGYLTENKVKWLLENNMEPNDNQKALLIPIICNNYALRGSIEEDIINTVNYLHMNNYPIFDLDKLIQYYYGGTRNKPDIFRIIDKLYESTMTITYDRLTFNKDLNPISKYMKCDLGG